MKTYISRIANNPIGYHLIALIVGILRATGLYWFNKESNLGMQTGGILFLSRVVFWYAITIALILPAIDFVIKKERTEADKEIPAKHSLLSNMALYTVMWLPSLIIKYPGALCYDTWYMINQYQSGEITAQHSVFYTIVLGKLLTQIEHNNIALFIFVLSHFVLMAFAFAYALCVIDKHVANPSVRSFAILWGGINPYIQGYIGVAIKDIPYAALMLVITACMVELVEDKNLFESDLRREGLLFCSILLCALVRINGIYAAFGICGVLLIKAITERKYYKTITIVMTAILAFVIINGTLVRKYDVIPSGTEHMLSVPLQQTARYVKYHGDDISSEEKEIIGSVMEYEKIADAYDPRISDPLKAIYKKNGNVVEFLDVWLKLFIRHPLCYISAYTEMYYYIFSPEASSSNIVLYQDDNIGYELWQEYVISERTPFYKPMFTNPQLLKPLKEWVVIVCRGLHANWIIGGITNLSVCVYTFVLLLGKLIADKKTFLIVFTPGLIAILFVLIGPAIYGHPRYLFPLAYSMPLLIGYTYRQYNRDLL